MYIHAYIYMYLYVHIYIRIASGMLLHEGAAGGMGAMAGAQEPCCTTGGYRALFAWSQEDCHHQAGINSQKSGL